MKLTVTRTIPGKYSGMDHTGDQYFTDDEEVEVEYEYEMQDFIEFLFEYKDEYIKEVMTSLIEDPGSLEELIEEEYANEFAKWLVKKERDKYE